MHRRLAALAGLVVLAGAVSAGPALAAATYPASDNAISVQGGSTSITVGSSVAFAAQTFQAASDVTFTVTSPVTAMGSSRGATLARAAVAAAAGCSTGSSCVSAADADGVATATITFTRAGKQTVTATGTGADGKALTLSSTVTVVAAGSASTVPSGSAGGLAKTGTDLVQHALVGVALIGVGALLVVTFRRRGGATA